MRFFLDEFEGVGVREEGHEFFLEMIGFSLVFVDVIFDGYLYTWWFTLYI